MNNIKVNLTTNSIYHALFRLLESNTFDEISVNDICQESLISRTTFYSYFEDKYELVLFCFSQERTKLGLIKGVDVKNNLLTFLKRIKEKKRVYKNLLVSHINRELRAMVSLHFKDAVDYILDSTIQGDQRDVLLMLYTGGISYTIMQWIEDDCHIDEDIIASVVWDVIYKSK